MKPIEENTGVMTLNIKKFLYKAPKGQERIPKIIIRITSNCFCTAKEQSTE
jgi:hypothetical protein